LPSLAFARAEKATAALKILPTRDVAAETLHAADKLQKNPWKLRPPVKGHLQQDRPRLKTLHSERRCHPKMQCSFWVDSLRLVRWLRKIVANLENDILWPWQLLEMDQ
jgi:hypothetical protein